MKLEINKNKPKTLFLRVPEDQFNFIRELAKKEDVQITEIIRAIIQAYIDKVNKK